MTNMPDEVKEVDIKNKFPDQMTSEELEVWRKSLDHDSMGPGDEDQEGVHE